MAKVAADAWGRAMISYHDVANNAGALGHQVSPPAPL